jgi:hypothetical protein
MALFLRVSAILLMALGHAMAETPAHHEFILCGWDEVFILDGTDHPTSASGKIWSWRAKDRDDLPEEYHSLSDSTDECKPFDDGRKVLITSSGGAVAYVDRVLDRVLFYGLVANAHSADLLPGRRVAVAASHRMAPGIV